MEVEIGRCSYRLSKRAMPTRQGFKGYSCPEQTELHEQYCIFHDDNPDKDAGMVCDRLQQKEDHCYIGYVFPRRFRFPITEIHDADFAHSHFHGSANFREIVFGGRTDFSIATFHQGAHFNGARFKGDVNLTGAEFSGQAWFNDVILDGCISLVSTYFKDEFWFTGISDVVAEIAGTVFEKEAHFHNTVFAAGSFIETQFRDRATFGYFKHMGNDLDLELASQSPDVVFFEGTDMKQLLFREANLTKASFNQCYNLDQAKFYDCTWNSESGRNHVLYDELEMRGKVKSWEEMAMREIRRRKGETLVDTGSDSAEKDQPTESHLEGKYEAVEETCRALKKHFEDRRNYLAAGDFHEGEMEMRRLAKGYWGRNLLSVEAFYWRLSRYGQRWLRPLVWLLGLVFAAAIAYAATGLQLSSSDQTLRWTSEPHYSSVLILDWLYVYVHSVFYSISVAALMRGVIATPTHSIGLLVQTIEFVLGPLLIFLIGVAIRRRLRR